MKVVLGIGAVLFVLLILAMVLGQGQQRGAPASAPLDMSKRFESVQLPTMESGDHVSFCRDKWTTRGETDQRMVDHCVESERRGYQELSSLVARHSDVPFLRVVVDNAIAKWTERGRRQDSMVAHTVKQEVEGFLNLEYERGQPGYSNAKADSCFAKWGVQYNMVAYCYKQR